MAEDNELEKRAIEELLRETDRARVRAETMGPAGWLKCPLQSTNKRFLLNTLRSTSLQQRTGEHMGGLSSTRGHLRSQAPERSRSRSPSRDHNSNGRQRDHKHHHRATHNKRQERDKERSHRHKDSRDQTHGKDGQNTEKNKHRR